jgi:hypothetical protein
LLLDLYARVVIVQPSFNLTGAGQGLCNCQTSVLPGKSPQLAPHLDAAVADRAGPPALEGRIVSARRKSVISGRILPRHCADQQRKHGWRVQAVRATVRSS